MSTYVGVEGEDNGNHEVGGQSSVITQIGSVGLGIPASCKVIYNHMSGCPGEM